MSHFLPIWENLGFAFEGMEFSFLSIAECRSWQGGFVSNRAVSALQVARQVLTV